MNILQKTIFLSLAFLLCSSALFGQSAKLKRANKYMQELNYSSAIELYQQILEDHDISEAKINLADCYRHTADSENAEYWYGQVVRLAEAEPINKLYYALALQENGKGDLAKTWVEEYIAVVPDNVRAHNLLKGLDMAEELMTKHAGIYEVRNLPINSDLDDFSPAIYEDNVIFASDRDRGSAIKREHTWTGSPFLELFKVQIKNESGQFGAETYGKPEKFSKDLNSKYHDAAVTFSADQSEIYFTRNNYKDGKTGKDDSGTTRLKVYYSRSVAGNGWGELESLPFNSDEYSVAHPCLTPDGERLFFASDMPGGFGGMDLWYSEKDNGRWGPPINMGNKVNTEGNEIFPTWQGKHTMYFSSNGLPGLGGLDIYRMDWDAENASWSDPENMGYPVNTTHDDLGIVLNAEGTFGYFSSDRPGGQGRDDIYSFVKTAAPVEVYVYDELTGKPLKGVTVTHSCAAGEALTDKDGIARFEIKLNTCCDYTAAMEGYDPNEKEGCTAGLTDVPVMVEIPLRCSVTISMEGVVYNQWSKTPLANALVTLTNDCDPDAVETVTTDESGAYSFLLNRDCCYKVKAEKQDFLADVREDQCTKNILEDFVVAVDLYLQPTKGVPTEDKSQTPPNLVFDPTTQQWINTNDGKPANTLVDGTRYVDGKIVPNDPHTWEPSSIPTNPDEPVAYLLHIYYDFDRATLRAEGIPELEKLYKMMTENPNLIIELASHTDARGSHRYNKRLSQRRAEAVVDWLVDKGVSLDRLVPRGYGETVPVNDCVNNVPCNERKHQMNRRTEFRILGCIGCVEPDKSKLSKPNDNARVDECKHCPF
ncbi:MAG: OmpA family protein [Saprospiraceae bacterium]|nr:OmpA family protein [Saprospiraceae bacterium]